MVDILGLVVKIDTILTRGILTDILDELKIDVAKIVEPKTRVLTIEVSKDDVSSLVDEEGFCSSVDEVEVTSINDVLS